jgi:hypothetical protein
MITTAPRPAYVEKEVTARALEDRVQRLVSRSLDWVQRSLCSLHGHDSILQYERNRIFLRCTSCGYETPGWDVTHTPAHLHPAPEARPTLTAPPDLAVARKIA